MVLGTTAVMPRIFRAWRSGPTEHVPWDPFHAPGFWGLGDGLWRGAYRAMLVLFVTTGAMGLMLVLPDEEGIASTLSLIVAWAIVGGGILAVLVIAFNRPKLVVQPWLRSQPGDFTSWVRRAFGRRHG